MDELNFQSLKILLEIEHEFQCMRLDRMLPQLIGAVEFRKLNISFVQYCIGMMFQISMGCAAVQDLPSKVLQHFVCAIGFHTQDTDWDSFQKSIFPFWSRKSFTEFFTSYLNVSPSDKIAY